MFASPWNLIGFTQVLKELVDITAWPFWTIYRRLWESGKVPADWKAWRKTQKTTESLVQPHTGTAWVTSGWGAAQQNGIWGCCSNTSRLSRLNVSQQCAQAVKRENCILGCKEHSMVFNYLKRDDSPTILNCCGLTLNIRSSSEMLKDNDKNYIKVLESIQSRARKLLQGLEAL